GLWAVAALDSAAARGLSRTHDPGTFGWGLRAAHAVRLPRGPAGRVRRGHGEQHAVGEARPALDGPGPDAVQRHGADRAPLRGNGLCGPGLDALAARSVQGRGRHATGAG